MPQRYSRLPSLIPERVALEVEEEVARRRVGQQREARVRLRLQELVVVAAALARAQLERRLAAELLERVRRPIPAGTRLVPARAERGERRDPAALEPLDLPPLDPGDAAEVVDRVPAARRRAA